MPSKTDDSKMLQKDFQSNENQDDTSNNARWFLIFRTKYITYLHTQNGEKIGGQILTDWNQEGFHRQADGNQEGFKEMSLFKCWVTKIGLFLASKDKYRTFAAI